MNKNIVVINGDGIGPEVTDQSIKVLKAIAKKYNHKFNFTHHLMGACAIDKTGNPLPDETLQACFQADAILFGAIGHPKYDNDPNAKIRPEQGLLKLRKELKLFANIRPIIMYQSLFAISPLKAKKLKGIDFIIYRELTGGIYFGKKELLNNGTLAIDECTYSVIEIERVANLAFKAALVRRKKLTLVDKANVLETSRLWRKVVQEMSKNYPTVTVEYLYVDNAAMQIILNPAQFDVILTDNMFGDIISDEASVLCGSLGLMPSASIGENSGLFEPIHGSYPQAAGKNIANPIGSILSASMLLEYLHLNEEANMLKKAVEWCIENNFVSQDIDPINNYSTTSIGDVIENKILKSELENNHIHLSTII